LASPKARLKSEFWVRFSGIGCSLGEKPSRDNARAAQRFGDRNDYCVAGLFGQPIPANEGRAVDEPKRQLPEIPPPPPVTEPQRSPPEIPDIHAPEKNSPTTGES